MVTIARLANIGSRWDARYLVNTVMGLLCRQDNPDADTVMDVVKRATEAVQAFGPRVSLVLKADIRPGFDGQIDAKVERVESALAQPEVS